MAEVDRLTVIARCEWICDDGCGRVDVRGAIEGPWPVCMNCGARVTKYAPASQLEGAVSLLAAIGQCANTHDALDETASVRVPLRLLRAARSATAGGQ